MIKVLYAGSPESAAETLKILLENQEKYGIKIVGVLTNPPTAKGRHKELTPTPVGQLALDYAASGNELPVFTPEHLNADARAQIEPLAADILVCFAYGHIFGPKFLAMFKMGGINLHPSLLPMYRGCTPVNACILNQDKETAFTIQTLSLGMDEGNILAQKKVSLTGTETAVALLNDAAVSGAQLILDLLCDADKNGALKEGVPQSGEPSYTQIIKKEDGKIDWTSSASKIDAQIRAYTPDPGTYCVTGTDEKPETLRILEAQVLGDDKKSAQNSPYKPEFENAAPGTVLAFDKPTGIWIKTADGILVVRKLQKQGKNAMGYKDFMNGTRDFIGSLLK